MWEKKRPRYHDKDRDEHYSISNKLKSENKITDEFEIMLCSLTLEDIIALKLELSSKILKNRFYGFDIWRNSGYIVKDALLKFAIANTNSKKDAARFLGLNYSSFATLVKKFKVDKYYD